MIREITIAKAGLRGLFAALRPHMVPNVKFEWENRGIGTLRVASASEVLVGSVVGKGVDRCAVVQTRILASTGVAEDVWLGANAVSAIIGMLEVSEANEVVVRVADAWVEVREEGVAWGGRKIRVPRRRAPWSEDIVDPTNWVSQALASPLVTVREEMILQPEDCRVFSKTCKALGAPLLVREVLTGNSVTYLWGDPLEDADAFASFVGVSQGPLGADCETTGELPVLDGWLRVLREVPVVVAEEPEGYVASGLTAVEAFANGESEADDVEDGGESA